MVCTVDLVIRLVRAAGRPRVCRQIIITGCPSQRILQAWTGGDKFVGLERFRSPAVILAAILEPYLRKLRY
jgi:hypothetical protein